jgi:tetratricopeptide (TPR) repeat protein
MRAYLLSLGALATVAFSLATAIEPWFQKWEGNRSSSANVLQVALGDSRRLFAKHFFVKADAYFHNGYYPTIYDNKDGYAKAHIAEDIHKEGSDEDEAGENFLGKPKDWIDRFSRHFFPARHTHLGDSGCGHSCCQRAREGKGHDATCEHKDDPGVVSGAEREILPWLRLSAELDPRHPETYVVTSFWLRRSLKKTEDAEQFLREGLQNNPGDPEILFELGRIYSEDRHDVVRARNVWELAVKNWRQRQAAKSDGDTFILGQLLSNLATLEWGQGDFARSAQWYRELLVVTPNKGAVRKWIQECETKLAGNQSVSGEAAQPSVEASK